MQTGWSVSLEEPDEMVSQVRQGCLRLISEEARRFDITKADHWSVSLGIEFNSIPEDKFAKQLHWRLRGLRGTYTGKYELTLTIPDPVNATANGVGVEAIISDEELLQSGFWAACDESGLTDYLATSQNARKQKTLRATKALLHSRGLLHTSS